MGKEIMRIYTQSGKKRARDKKKGKLFYNNYNNNNVLPGSVQFWTTQSSSHHEGILINLKRNKDTKIISQLMKYYIHENNKV